jgi:hypothetical protein
VLWVVVALVTMQQTYAHSRSRTVGYLSFYRQSLFIRRVPLYVLSLGSNVLLVLLAIMRDNTHSVFALQLVVSVETVVCLAASLMYMIGLSRFNKRRDLPDVHRELLSRAGGASLSESANEKGVEMGDTLEKQADIIRFMKQHNDSLSRRIRHLTDQVGEYERGIQ